ncbi:hypothetical protein CPHO_05110 [Corynebacterium phocae]|uniref:Uncharacterized protein n=1 Tax=Corynebacterium phocae TaxID=161895 RepID=A0A1L7D2M0_9CORY|nr:hypothetical protein [Corynebacterium phocae]APT92374.1 hypothetical protein CPHO_05110 [Corynebacterium phocae]KAA8724965.1 hypothetical protein F4V58_04645 [Corynebacterium phocae]
MGFGLSSHQVRLTLSVVLTFVACVALVLLLKVPGVIISIFLAAAVWLMATARPAASEEAALRTSIQLSAEDLRDVMEDFERFETSPSAEALADRTLHRPALLDLDVVNPEIEDFHHQYTSAARYLNRLPARLADPTLTPSQLEKLLNVTDQRADDLRESWMRARRAAKALGTDYNSKGPS